MGSLASHLILRTVLGQIYADVVVHGLRPEIPLDLDGLPGGSFQNIRDYILLLTQCWSEDPEDRPGLPAVIGLLRQLIEATMQDASYVNHPLRAEEREFCSGRHDSPFF